MFVHKKIEFNLPTRKSMYYMLYGFSNMAVCLKMYAISKNNVYENDDVIKWYFYLNKCFL